MSWLNELLGKLRRDSNTSNSKMQPSNQIISTQSKVDTSKKSTPNRDLHTSKSTSSSFGSNISRFSEFSAVSKTNNQYMTRAQPNNPETKARVDRLTGTFDSE